MFFDIHFLIIMPNIFRYKKNSRIIQKNNPHISMSYKDRKTKHYTMRNFLNPSSSKSLISLFISSKVKCTNNAFAKFYAAVVITLLFTAGAMGQITNYKFGSSTTTPNNISSTGTLMVGTGSAIGFANGANVPIGFTFNYLGNDYTTFSVNTAGLLRLGAIATTESANNISTVTNTAKIMPWWDATSTGTNGGVRYLLSGTAPNRDLTIQWNVSNAAGSASSTSYQVKLYETSNKIEFIYFCYDFIVT